MDRNSPLCPLHYLDASHFCLCQSGITYVCSSCFSKHEGHEVHPTQLLDLLQMLSLDRAEFQARLDTHKHCSNFLDLLSAREVAVQSSAVDLIDRLAKACKELLQRRHRGFETVVDLLREETEMLLTDGKLRLSPLAQAVQEKGSALGQKEIEAFLAFPEQSVLEELLNKAEEGCVGSQRVWQRDYEDQILATLSGDFAPLSRAKSCISISSSLPSVAPAQPSVPLQSSAAPSLPSAPIAPPQSSLASSLPSVPPLTSTPSFIFPEFKGPIPNYLTPEGQATLQHLGPFNYQDDESSLVKHEPVSVEGGIYIGQWNSQDQRHGQGKQIWPDGRVYEGQWRFGKFSGKGRLIGIRGEAYIGDFENDKYHGFGLLYDHEGGVYNGGWAAGKKDGIGYMRAGQKSPIAGGVYYGDWSEGNIQGSGVLFFSDGSVYAGGWKAGCKHGKGIFSHPTGAFYTGEYSEGLFSGPGLYIWKEGHIYRGEWKANKRWGMGRMTQPGLEFYEGPWMEDKEHGTGSYRSWNGTTESRHYRNGARV